MFDGVMFLIGLFAILAMGVVIDYIFLPPSVSFRDPLVEEHAGRNIRFVEHKSRSCNQ